jgi:glycosyltransferase involved in cell wall biosynthesis
MEMHFYGEGAERVALTQYIHSSQLQNYAYLHGNVNSEELKPAYMRSHFLLFFSKSEGWPKAVSEAMWWGCVPVTTPVSCVPWMIQSNIRGMVVKKMQTENISEEINLQMQKIQWFESASQNAQTWVRKYSLDSFQLAIQKLI